MSTFVDASYQTIVDVHVPSPTSNHMYLTLSCGARVHANPSTGIATYFPGDVVQCPRCARGASHDAPIKAEHILPVSAVSLRSPSAR